MTPPPPTPQHHHDMLVDAITRGAASQTPAPHVAAAAPPPSSPVSALKRHSSQERDGTVSGVNSPANKRTDARPTPTRRIRFDPNLPTPMQIEPPDVTALVMDVTSDTPRDIRPENTTTITPSPSNDTESSTTSQPSTIANSKKKKSKPKKPKRIVLDSKIFTFIRPDVFDPTRFRGSVVYTREDMDDFDRNYQKQLNFNFAQTRASKKQLQQSVRASRSLIFDDLDCNYAAFNVKSTNFQELSRYILEDLLKCGVGDKFLLCLTVSSGSTHEIDLKSVAATQREHKVGGDKCKISGREYFCLKVVIDYSPNHSDIGLNMSESQFTTLFNNKSGGFRVCFAHTEIKLMLKWFDIVNSPRDIMFFGRPFSMNRQLDYLMKDKFNLQYVHHVFRHLSDQLYGDSTMSSLLYASYQKRRSIIFEKSMNEALARENGIYDEQTFNTPRARSFCKVFNNHCRNCFVFCLSEFQDYSKPMMLEDDWNNWMILAEDVYNKQWRFLLSLRNVASGDSEELISYKKRQVFCQLMTLQRVANYKTLGYWALILSTAYYGWGVRGSAIVATSFWGVTNSTNYRDAKYSGLLLCIDYVRKRLLRRQSTGLFTYDNIVVVSGLLHQRGRSSKVLSATHMVSHEAREFNDTSFDDQRVPLTYDTNQTSSSPCDMYCYEAYDFDAVTTGVDVFLHHTSIAQSYEPDFTGQRVRSYRNYCKLAKDITFLVNVFRRSDECFKNVPTFIDSVVIHELRQICGKTNIKSLQDKCYSFKWDSVKAWNPHVSKVTKSLMLGIVGIDEGSAEGAMTCVLDLLLKYGVLQEEEDGSWSKVETDPPRRSMVGRIRQGNLVGAARRCKRQIQSYYSQGPSRVVNKHGSGIKGNHHLEKDLIFEFTAKFLGDMTLNCSRRLQPKSIANIKCTTDLKRDKLVREMTDDSNSETNRLFNSVQHVQQSARGELEDVDEGVTEYELEQARIMEEEYDFDREQQRIESSHQNEEDVYDEDDCVDPEQDSAVKGYCVNDMWKLGSESLDKMNVKTSRQKQRDRLERKKRVQKVILQHVEDLKKEAANVIIDAEEPEELGSIHSNYLRSLDVRRYQD